VLRQSVTRAPTITDSGSIGFRRAAATALVSRSVKPCVPRAPHAGAPGVLPSQWKMSVTAGLDQPGKSGALSAVRELLTDRNRSWRRPKASNGPLARRSMLSCTGAPSQPDAQIDTPAPLLGSTAPPPA